MRWIWLPALIVALAAHVAVFVGWQLATDAAPNSSKPVTLNLQVQQSAQKSADQKESEQIVIREAVETTTPEPEPEPKEVAKPKAQAVEAQANVAQNPDLSDEDAYLEALSAKLSESLFYPDKAKRRKWEGSVLLSIRIEPNGGLRLVRVKETSGYALLDQAAVTAVRKAIPLPTPPAGRSDFDVPLKFSLE